LKLSQVDETFSNVRSHIQEGKPFAVISAWKNNMGYNTERNRERNIELINDLRSSGLGGVKMKGRYQEMGKPASSVEISFFVPYNGDDLPWFKREMERLCGLYDQECICFSDGQNLGYLYPNGQFEKQFSKANFDVTDIEGFWSSMRGHTIQFETAFCSGNSAFQDAYRKSGLISDLKGISVRDVFERYKDQGVITD
jgi:hypothetical protein